MTVADPAGNADEPILRAEHLTKTYGSGETQVNAIVDVELTARRGELLLIMGPSGSGKTTLLSLMGGLTRPTSGTVCLAGNDLSTMPERERVRVRRDLVGFIFQDFNLLGALSARENVEMALNLKGMSGRAAQDRATTLLSELGLAGRLLFKPAQLSGGEKQRVAIARALANEPTIILADEPTANLDARHGLEVVSLLASIARDQARAVIMVSHDLRIRELASRIAWLEDGRLKFISDDAAADAGDSAGNRAPPNRP